jgi:hypothetical protein
MFELQSMNNLITVKEGRKETGRNNVQQHCFAFRCCRRIRNIKMCFTYCGKAETPPYNIPDCVIALTRVWGIILAVVVQHTVAHRLEAGCLGAFWGSFGGCFVALATILLSADPIHKI